MSQGIQLSKRTYLLIAIFLIGIILMSFVMKGVVEGWTQPRVHDTYHWTNDLSNMQSYNP